VSFARFFLPVLCPTHGFPRLFPLSRLCFFLSNPRAECRLVLGRVFLLVPALFSCPFTLSCLYLQPPVFPFRQICLSPLTCVTLVKPPRGVFIRFFFSPPSFFRIVGLCSTFASAHRVSTRYTFSSCGCFFISQSFFLVFGSIFPPLQSMAPPRYGPLPPIP